MALPPTWIRASVATVVVGRPCFNILWYNTDLTPNPGEGQNIVTAMASILSQLIAAPLKAWLASDAAYAGVEMSLSINGAVFTATSTSGIGAGTGGVDALPAYAAAIVQKRTILPGRSGRGRWYIPGCPEGFTAGSVLTGPGQAALSALATMYNTALSDESGAFQPCHHYGPGEGTLAQLTGVRPLVTLGTMRRRMVRPKF